MKNIRKTLSIVLAIMMILSSLPIMSLAAEAPTITEWPTITTTVEVGMLYKDLAFEGGSASVPGVFSHNSRYAERAITRPSSSGTQVRMTFTPDDTTTYNVVNSVSSNSPRVLVNPCSNPILQGELTAKKILPGTALSAAEPALADGAVILANTTDITARVDSITFDSPDKVYTELGTYDEPITIKFKAFDGLPYAVDLKTTVKVTVSDKLDAEILTVPTITGGGVTESSTAKELTLTGGTANVEGTFTVTDPDQKLIAGANTINVTFTPTDTSKYNPTTADVAVTLKGKAPLPDEIIYTLPFKHGQKAKNINFSASSAGITEFTGSFYVKNGNNTTEFLETVLYPGTYKCSAMMYINGEYADMYEQEIVDITLVITQQKQTNSQHRLEASTKVQNDGSYLIEAGAWCYYPEYMQGNVIIKVNGEKIGEEKLETSRKYTKFQYVAKKTGTYVVTAEYVPTETDCYVWESDEFYTVSKSFDLDITMHREVKSTGKNCDIESIYPVTEEGLAVPGGSVTVRAVRISSDEQFDGWTFYDDEGNEFIPEGLSEDYMTLTYITFTMPNHDVRVKANVSKIPSSGDDDSSGGLELPDLELPEIEFDPNGTHKYDLVNMIQNLIAKLKAFIYEIGAFFGAIDAEDVSGAIEGIL